MARAGIALVLLATAIACSSGRSTETFDEAGLAFRYPSGWHVTGFSTTNSPHRLAIASYPLPDDAVEGDCGGLGAIELLPQQGALIILIDYGAGASFPELPHPLRLGDGEFAEYECFGASTMFRFRIGDRDMQAHVALGSDAGQTMGDRVLAILESLTTSSQGE